ncbi:hypothetical protein LTR84_004106 [Exophiala bonariae]|uniref:Clr5 domain-containing protein n=1 Tax=Exophiala bonariae TaxID=1690606 RepID=A0AAV9N902_9EURO|nr:hypothetical protein LTR84_004106 [Exophiala bonariae]
MASNARYPTSASDWQPYRALITRLYKDEDRTLEDVMKVLKTQYGFRATNKMFKSRIKSWGLDKHNKAYEVEEILRLLAARETIGKDTVFLLRGRPVDLAAIEKSARRKRSRVAGRSKKPAHINISTTRTVIDLICLTPPPVPLSLLDPDRLRNAHCFLHFSQAFVQDSLHSGNWTLHNDLLGFACLQCPIYPTGAPNAVFQSIERGIRWYTSGEVTQAYRQWRLAFSQLPLIVSSPDPSQLVGLIDLISHLAACESQVAGLLLRYLGELSSRDRHCSRSSLAMLRSLSRLEVKDLSEIAERSKDCFLEIFGRHFPFDTFFFVDSGIILMKPNGRRETAGSGTSQIGDMTLNLGSYDGEDIRGPTRILEILIPPEQYPVAEELALVHMQRLRQMKLDESVATAISHVLSCLVHLYLSQRDYEKAHQGLMNKLDHHFEMLRAQQAGLSEESMLSTYSLLEILARELGRSEDVSKWSLAYFQLKNQTDVLAENEKSTLQAMSKGSHQNTAIAIEVQDPPRFPTLEIEPLAHVDDSHDASATNPS